MVIDHGIPLILCTIDEAARARQWDRVRLLTEGLCARLTDDKTAMLDWLRQLQRVYRKYAVPECGWSDLSAAVDAAIHRLALNPEASDV